MKEKRLKYFAQINISTRGTFIPPSVVSGYTGKPLLDSTHPPFIWVIQIMSFSVEKKSFVLFQKENSNAFWKASFSFYRYCSSRQKYSLGHRAVLVCKLVGPYNMS